MGFRYSKALQLAAFALSAAFGAMPALANYDGTLDTTLNPPLWTATVHGGVPGFFDYGLNLGGIAPYTNNDYVAATAVQVDGKILAAGWSWNTLNDVDQNACVLTRFNQDGTPDTGFSSSGQAIINFDSPYNCYFNSLALQGDGKIVAAGNLYNATNGEYGVVFRFNADGSFDPTFGGGGYVLAGQLTAFSSVAINSDGSIISAGHTSGHIGGGYYDVDFFFEVWDGNNGAALDWQWASFNLGADLDDRAYAMVLHDFPQGCGQCGTELYLVGSANNTAYGDLANHDCAIVAYVKYWTDTKFHLDARFNGSGSKSIDFPIAPSYEGDNICRAAVARPGGGVIIGGENYFISTLGGGTPALASNYALAEVDATGNVTRHDSFAFFQALPTPGIFNGIFSVARAPDGKLIVAGYAGTGDSNHQPSDIGVIRLNLDFSFDPFFGNDGLGRAILSLDGLDGLATGQREWATALALDNHGRIVVVGERSYDYPGGSGDYNWLVGRLNVWDGIFRDGFDGVVPTVR